MPTALCECGKAVHWRNRRGMKLADVRCECGRTGLKAAKMAPEGGYVVRESSAPRGTMCKCALCGRRRRVPGGGVALKEPTIFRVYFSNTGSRLLATDYSEEERPLQAGDVVCWHHSPAHPIFLGART